jgi:hypothetical protein
VPFPRSTFKNQTKMLIATNPNNIEIGTQKKLLLSIVNSLNVIFYLEVNLLITNKKRM